MYFLHVSTTGKIIEKLARINEVSSLAGQPIPWKCEVFLWEQAFNFAPAEDRGTEQIGLRGRWARGSEEVVGGRPGVDQHCVCVCVEGKNWVFQQ